MKAPESAFTTFHLCQTRHNTPIDAFHLLRTGGLSPKVYLIPFRLPQCSHFPSVFACSFAVTGCGEKHRFCGNRKCWIPGHSFHPHLDPPPSAGGGRIRKSDYCMARNDERSKPQPEAFLPPSLHELWRTDRFSLPAVSLSNGASSESQPRSK